MLISYNVDKNNIRQGIGGGVENYMRCSLRLIRHAKMNWDMLLAAPTTVSEK